MSLLFRETNPRVRGASGEEIVSLWSATTLLVSPPSRSLGCTPFVEAVASLAGTFKIQLDITRNLVKNGVSDINLRHVLLTGIMEASAVNDRRVVLSVLLKTFEVGRSGAVKLRRS